jgi:dihydrofolate reductase
MARLIVSEFLTLDGVMQAPGASDEDKEEGFQHGGWQMPLFDDAMGQAVDRGMKSMTGLVLGRKTYEIFAGYWPNQPDDNPFAATFNSVPKYVASRTLSEPLEWSNSSLLGQDVAAALRELKEETDGDLIVIGSGDLAQTLMENDLVDEYQIMIHPLVLGTGKRLFREGSPVIPLRLIDHKTSSTGVLILTYRPGEKE